MATLVNGHVNGDTDTYQAAAAQSSTPAPPLSKRFSDVPTSIDVPIAGDADNAVEVNLEELPDDPTELCTLLHEENAACGLWLAAANAHAKQGRLDDAVDILDHGLKTLHRIGATKDKVGLLSLKSWLFLLKHHAAPRVAPEDKPVGEAQTKDYYLQAATAPLNEAAHIRQDFPPFILARGVLSLLRASLQPPPKILPNGRIEQGERRTFLADALKSFKQASDLSSGLNMMAALGEARTLFSMAQYAQALEKYQHVLSRMPDLLDPDPRIGIGCCLWQLSYHKQAQNAWERALELVAHTLLGLFYLKDSGRFDTSDPEFTRRYRRAMTRHIHAAYQLDQESPLACAALGGYFLPRQDWAAVERLGRRAINMTDVNAVASDGWYLLARAAHYRPQPDWARVQDCYARADNARGGGEMGFAPAKLGLAQAQCRTGDRAGARFRLEKLAAKPAAGSFEVKVFLGTLYAHEAVATAPAGPERRELVQKATALLSTVRLAWKDPKKKVAPDVNVLLTLARLYEMSDQPEKALASLLDAQQMGLADLRPELANSDAEDGDEEQRRKLRAHLPPQLLNNIACFQFQLERFAESTETFQLALNACMNLQDGADPSEIAADDVSDRLVTTISFNLGRSYEGAGELDEAKKMYEAVLARHADYTDAKTRLAYVALMQSPKDAGPKAMAKLYETESTNLEVRALYGWYLHRSKGSRPLSLNEDPEQRVYKHTLQYHEKHDTYALTGLGNLNLAAARETRGGEAGRERRRRGYERAVEFFAKALALDPHAAYAAQGLAIAQAEEQRAFAPALATFAKVRDAVRADSSPLVNMAHCHAELRQYARAIELYEAAVAKDRGRDPQILSALGRACFLRGKLEKQLPAMKAALGHAQRAQALSPHDPYLRFNVALVQSQLGQLVPALPAAARSAAEIAATARELDAAIAALEALARADPPPLPRENLEMRANMCKNTLRKQLERALAAQRDYEAANAEKVAAARAAREAEAQAKRDAQAKADAAAEAERARIAAERRQLLAASRALAEARAAEEKAREEAELTEDSRGERVKRTRKRKAAGGAVKRKKKSADAVDDDDEDALAPVGSGAASGSDSGSGARPSRRRRAVGDGDGEAGDAPRKKKRRLARRGEAHANAKPSKYKSAEMIVDSDEDDMAGGGGGGGAFDVSEAEDDDDSAAPPATQQPAVLDTGLDGDGDGDAAMPDAGDDEEEADEDGAVAVAATRRGKAKRAIADDDDEDEDAGSG